MSEIHPEGVEPAAASPSGSRRPPRNVPLAVLWAIVVAIIGGYVCGLAISRFGSVGSISLWGLGALAGHVGRKILGAPSRPVAWCLVTACTVAFVFAEVCWIHWNTVQGREGWWTAIGFLPAFVDEYSLSALIGAIFTFTGALSAFQQTARRYRIVMVVEE